MPAIRDASFAYESVTTDSGITIPMCAYQQNDLLFAIAVCDVAVANTWGCSNGVGSWNLLTDLDNSAGLAIFWKYAAASGEGDVAITVTAAVNDTYSGAVIAVRDVYQSYTGGSPPVNANATATGTRFTLPTINTSADNSLCLAVVSSTATAPSLFFVESELQDLVKVDGTAEGLGVGWFFKKTSGTTTAFNVGALVSGAGSKVVIECRAPAGGATVIPAYPVSDASILLSPQMAIAWDSNTAMAATADTNFGTSINGITCNDGTVATANDIGLDKDAFMSMAGVTNAATANQMSGAEAVVAAARYNVGSRNILCHFRHPTPVQNQRLQTVGSGKGVWMGMKSGATALANWKVWQVHGADAPMPPGYVMPIIIADGNTDTIAVNSTLTTSDIRRYGFWTGGIGVLTQQACFGPLWAMDSLVMAGGVSAEPIDAEKIVNCAAKYKNRFSSLLQGANQMLCLQQIQFGNGGTNPVFLKVNGGAVEFPSKKNVAKKIVNYNGTDDSVGWTFYPGASDTIDLAGTVFASASKFHWRIHASASGSATYNFSGVSLIGAGDVQLRAVTTFADMAFTTCPTVYTNGATVQNCTFLNSKVFVSSPANAALISDSTFTKNTGTSHALEISGSAADFTLDGVNFSGYAGSNGSTGNEAIYVNIASGTVNISIVGGGSIPSIRTAGATVNVTASVSVTLTGLKNPTEIRVFNAGTTTERSGTGAENVTTGTHVFTLPSGTAVDISILSLGYQNTRLLNYSTTSDATVPISQVIDRQYQNP